MSPFMNQELSLDYILMLRNRLQLIDEVIEQYFDDLYNNYSKVVVLREYKDVINKILRGDLEASAILEFGNIYP